MPKLAERPPGAAASSEADFYRWTQEQAALLRAGRWSALDRDALAEEIADLGGSQKSEIRSRLTVLLQHLLKWEFQPQHRKYGWRATIIEQRVSLADVLEMSPSLGRWPGEVLARAYRLARVRAAEETGLPEQAFPAACPYSLDRILDDGFYPGPEERDVV
ncbi:DUF29 domain-containing protein [Methylobacterium oryzihabitans]|uniref:DUF29 domain-containing protein n=1 Tax=Methylobacterium oryzihabitans TaxID=2499852 RepID=A0A437PHV1_9HYPH|nr:DUF29 domain-containing protein [Methylobacterium oryzihabitans]RVU21862.1 DUF29 domain-containing protein [Methylobacterium oryzihabitans]